MSENQTLKENLIFLKQTKAGRQYLINQINIQDEVNWQHNATPYSIVDKMIEKTVLDNKKILVLFNIEFIEQLIHVYNVNSDGIFFFADTELEQNFAKSVYGVTSVWSGETIMKKNGLLPRIYEMGQKNFDLVFSNPPYNANIDLKILQTLKPIANEMIVVHPSTWLIDLKGKNTLYEKFKNNLKLKSVELFDGTKIFSIVLDVPCVISHFANNKNGNIKVKIENDEFTVNDISDITKFGKHWEYLVKPFTNVIKHYVSNNGSLLTNKLGASDITSNGCYAQLASVIGNGKMTMVQKNHNDNKGIRKASGVGTETRIHPTYKFSTDNEVEHFLNYCKTDFARFCMALLRNSSTLNRAELELVPWMDFTQEWNDEKLFTYFEIDQETQDYIRAFLPDYHGIRK